MLIDTSVKGFLADVASKKPAPGGGTAAPVVAALAASLGSMVANLTSGKASALSHQQRIEYLIVRTSELQAACLDLSEKDAQAFLPVSHALALPRATPEEVAFRDAELERTLECACQPPLEVMDLCMEILKLLDELSRIGTKLALSDTGVGAEFCRAAIRTSALNVYINSRLMHNREQAQALNLRAKTKLAEGEALANQIYNDVEDYLLTPSRKV